MFNYRGEDVMQSSEDTTEQRRRSNRVRFKTEATLTLGNETLPCTVIDLSIRGVLLMLQSTVPGLDVGTPCSLDLSLGDEGEQIRMNARLAHTEGLQLGLHCIEMDLDSVTNLRRLVELNLTDPDAIERDLSALLESVQRD